MRVSLLLELGSNQARNQDDLMQGGEPDPAQSVGSCKQLAELESVAHPPQGAFWFLVCAGRRWAAKTMAACVRVFTPSLPNVRSR
jgi:hypothetical protein